MMLHTTLKIRIFVWCYHLVEDAFNYDFDNLFALLDPSHRLPEGLSIDPYKRLRIDKIIS